MNESKQPGIDGVQENEINLFELLYGLWRKRSIIFAFTALATVLILCAGYYVYATRSVFNSYQLTFRLVFAGAEKGEYPNGEPFNQSDIMSPSILEQVFQINDLANVYPFKKSLLQKTTDSIVATSDSVGAYKKFMRSVSLIRTGTDAILSLENQYLSKMKDPKLAFGDRDAMEKEFLAKKQTLLNIPEFKLVFSSDVDPTLAAKILGDILRVWSEQADRIHGISKFKGIALFTKDSVKKETFDKLDFLLQVDVLRKCYAIVKADLERVLRLPGAATYRSKENRLRFVDLLHSMNLLRDVYMQPVYGEILGNAITKNIGEIRNYLDVTLKENTRKMERASSIEKTYEQGLQQYQNRSLGLGKGSHSDSAINANIDAQQPISSSLGMPAVIPQLGSSFIDNSFKCPSRTPTPNTGRT